MIESRAQGHTLGHCYHQEGRPEASWVKVTMEALVDVLTVLGRQTLPSRSPCHLISHMWRGLVTVGSPWGLLLWEHVQLA